MSTQNATITAAWSLIADTGDDQLLIQAADPASGAAQGHIQYQIAAMSTQTLPAVIGHTIYTHLQAVNRATIGAGYLYARLTYSSVGAASAKLVISGSTEVLI